ncbi:hypothetical protein FA13DRAFT_1149808 [Coprinellus micaceus]|uniref:Nephrocystin 3-like N-terminal domain-containing protein n=1 Tax=Coprinellus micaceus TaxID=71717 RepID=A0A4Y7SV06_COPMI|nr:hypothetical protein FA13DRAFT_1149808 [Coprinellus micaceus]
MSSKRAREPGSDDENEHGSRKRTPVPPGSHNIPCNHYHGPVNHIGQVNNANLGISYAPISQSSYDPPPGSWASVSRPPVTMAVNLVSLLKPILDASHTRNVNVSPPHSRCFDGTRQEVIGMVLSRAKAPLEEDKPHILWIYGYAGCGKSAISQAVAEQLSREGRLAASFFFFRGSGDRSGLGRFAGSIAHQIAVNFPSTASIISDTIQANPGLLKMSTSSLSNQFEHLVFRPILAVAGSLNQIPLIIALDGVDECGEHDEVGIFIEETITFFGRNPGFPLRFVIASRVEDHIYQRLHSSNQVQLLNLVEYTSDRDISKALDMSFAKEKRGRLLACDDSWPSADDKWKLVKHIGGSYIFMTTIIKLLFAPSTKDGLTPMERLPQILEMKPDFDDLYREILEPCSHFPFFSEILTTIALAFEPLSIAQIAELLDIGNFKVTNVLINLHAIMQVPGNDRSPVTLWHTSLRDFLCTEGRSGPFFASPEHHCRLARGAVKMAALPLNSHSREYAQFFAMAHLAKLARCTDKGLSLFRMEDHSTILILDKPVFKRAPEPIQFHPIQADGLPALEAACHEKDWKLVRALANWGANVNTQFRGEHREDYTVPLHAACHHMAEEAVYSLLDKGADPNIASQSTSTSNWGYYAFPLAWAATEGDVDLVNQLLAWGADPNLKGGWCQRSALHTCALSGKDKVARNLLEHGANPNIQNTHNWTPLHYASRGGHFRVVQCLLEFQADPNMKSRSVSLSALHFHIHPL